MFQCKLCYSYKMGNYDNLQFKSLGENGKSVISEMKICKECASVIEELGMEDKGNEVETREAD